MPKFMQHIAETIKTQILKNEQKQTHKKGINA